MALFNCDNKYNCTALAILASIIIGIVAGILTITGVITVTPAFLWVTLGIAVVYLAVTLVAAAVTNGAFHCGTPLRTVLGGILGTVLFSIILLAVEFAATSVVGAIVTGLLLFFFSLTITATVCLVECVAKSNN